MAAWLALAAAAAAAAVESDWIAGLEAVGIVGPASRPPSKSKLRPPSESSIREGLIN